MQRPLSPIEVSVNGDTYKVRYIGIDTPETKHPEKPVEWMGEEATAKNEESIRGKAALPQPTPTPHHPAFIGPPVPLSPTPSQ